MTLTQRNIEVDSDVWSGLKAEAEKRNKNVREFAGEILAEYLKGKTHEVRTKPKVIILAAGQVNRLAPLTNNLPACMLNINGKPLLERLLDTFKECGLTNISLVKGYKKSAIKYPNIKYYYNKNYKNNKTLESLFCAKSEMSNEFIVSYADIWVDTSIVNKLLESSGDISIVVDVQWMEHYKDRYHHPIEEAEKVVVKNGKIEKIGKTINPNEAHGEFVGLIKFNKRGAEILKENYKRIMENHDISKPFHTAISLEKAYLTDMIQELIDKGCVVSNVDVNGKWFEIDTIEDFRRVQKLIE
jgi:phosphoenolpyruvate phosphomutase